jgi:hypothetical protein
VFVNIKPLHISVFFLGHLQEVLRCALCRYYSSRRITFVDFVLLRSMWPHVYVICVCLVFLSVGDLLVNKQITNRQEQGVRSRLHRGCSSTSKFSFLRISTVWTVSASVMDVDWRPVPSPCLTLVLLFLYLSLH